MRHMKIPSWKFCDICGSADGTLVYLASKPPYRPADDEWSLSLCRGHGGLVRNLVKEMTAAYRVSDAKAPAEKDVPR
jgi:hypothetical protein